jgi:hypothetical protein
VTMAMRPTLLAAAAAVSLAVLAAASLAAPAAAQGRPDDALRAALEESKSSGKGLSFHIRGSTIGGAVTGVGDKFVTVKNQAGIAVIRIDSIDAVAGAITLK